MFEVYDADNNSENSFPKQNFIEKNVKRTIARNTKKNK